MKTLTWTGIKGNTIELKAECKIEMKATTTNLDGDIFKGKAEPVTSANLELYIDGKKVDSSWDINFWQIVDLDNGFKKIWGLKIAMTAEQAIIVDEFLKNVIESGKAIEVIKNEKVTAAKENEKALENAKATVIKYESQTIKLNNEEYKKWRTNYNNVNNEGGEGYVPCLVTTEQYLHALDVIIITTDFKDLEQRFGTIKFKGKTFWLTSHAILGDTLLTYTHNYNNPDNDGNYYFDMTAFAIDENEIEFKVTWIFNTEKDEDGNSKELDDYDYDCNIDNVEEI